MVLKVVTGKILETLELSLHPTARSFILNSGRIEPGAMIQVVKDLRLSYR